MASITIRNLSNEAKERLRHRAKSQGLSLESFARSLLDQAAHAPVAVSRFPHDLIALVEPGQDIDPFIAQHDRAQPRVEL